MPSFPVTNGIETFSKPPDGYVVDFDNPKRQLLLEHYLVFAIGSPLALIALAQRFYTKIWLANGLHVDDALMFLGWSKRNETKASTSDSVVQKSFCVHSWEMPLARFEMYSVVAYVAGPMFMLCNGFTKLSLLTVYLQLSPQGWYRVCIWVTIIFVGTSTATITFALFIHCAPIRKAYDIRVDGGTCLDASFLYMANTSISMFTDVIMFVLPIPMIYRLRLGIWQKLGAMLMFSIGSVTVATSFIKLMLLPALFKTTDFSWESAPANVWSFVEANLFVICGSMPTLRKFFQNVSVKLSRDPQSKYRRPYLIHISDPTDRSRQEPPSDELAWMSPNRMYHQQLRAHQGGLAFFEEAVLPPASFPSDALSVSRCAGSQMTQTSLV
ncbi:hypothetical protein CPLU01_06285 [Colletotrichum plurivorum]|uniref:Rhodopsin domain-containing protein n=1 Tax=Colletotrichum plurivorum TaxID=2175906 RepID=A0A8H6NH04_9PEZI|nr:hypothetical protein CPLU01_06285 [Colletotrichum plurivorum]